MAFCKNVWLAAEVAQKLMGPEPQPIVHIPCPAGSGSGTPQQWQTALRDWSD